MEFVSVDVLHYVLSEVWSSDRRSFLEATLVCKLWHQIAQPILTSHLDNVIISPGAADRNHLLFHRIASDDHFCRGIHHITVCDVYVSGLVYAARPYPGMSKGKRATYGYREPRSDSTWRQIEQLARAVSKIDPVTFTWKAMAPIPSLITKSLESTTQCSVQIRLRHDWANTNYGVVASLSLATSKYLANLGLIAPKLTRLALTVPASELKSPGVSPKSSSISRLLSTSPLRALEIVAATKLFLPDSYSFQEFETVDTFEWLSGAADHLLRLEDLRLSNFCLCDATPETFELVQRSVKWQNIRKAHFTCASFLRILSAEHAQLSLLRLDLDSDQEKVHKSCPRVPCLSELRGFLLSQTSLKVVKVTNGTGIFQSDDAAYGTELFGHLGRSLHTLTMHENEGVDGKTDVFEKQLLSLQTVREIGRLCPQLRRLGLDVPTEETQLHAFLRTIRDHIPFVEHLELSTDVERPAVSPKRLPVTRQRCVQLWNDLQDAPGRLRLQSLLINIGALPSAERRVPLQVYRDIDQRRVLIRRATHLNKTHAEGGKDEEIIVESLDIKEFEERLRHDENARYGTLTRDGLKHMRKVFEEGGWTTIAPGSQTVCKCPRII